MKYIRCSALPIVGVCGQASNKCNDIHIDPIGTNVLGTAVHECLAEMVMGNRVDTVRAADSWGVNEKAVRVAFYSGKGAWANLSEFFPEPEVEVELKTALNGEVVITGHTDVISKYNDPALGEDGEETVNILDWKFDELNTRYWKQQIGYAFLGMKKYDVKTARMILLSLMSGEFWIQTITIDEAKAELEAIWKTAQDETFHPGEHCRWCQNRYDCAGRNQMIISTIHDVTGEKVSICDVIQAGELESLLGRIKIVKDTLKNLESNIKDEIRDMKRVRSGDKYWFMRKEPHRRDIDLTEGNSWYRLQELVGQNSLIDLVGKISLKKVCEAITSKRIKEAERAGTSIRGIKTRVQEEVEKEFEGVIVEKPREMLRFENAEKK